MDPHTYDFQHHCVREDLLVDENNDLGGANYQQEETVVQPSSRQSSEHSSDQCSRQPTDNEDFRRPPLKRPLPDGAILGDVGKRNSPVWRHYDLYKLNNHCFAHNHICKKYWVSSRHKYPRMARDILAIPITSVASESSFSMGARILSKLRASLLPKNVEIFVTTSNWLFGFYEG